MRVLRDTCSRIAEVNHRIAEQTQQRLNNKTKPRGSLGRLEELACRVASIQGTAVPALPQKAIVVMGADHGVAEESVSAYPQDVTGQMILNIARGGAAINVLARHVGARLMVVDMGVKQALPKTADVRSHRIGEGTKNFTRGPAMSRDEAVCAMEVGIQLSHELVNDGVSLLGIGDMGIGNTTAASAMTVVFTGAIPDEVTGRGTGIDDAGYRRKIDAIQRGLAINCPDPNDAVDVLAKVGGFEIAGLAGVVLGSAASRVPLVVDGFISTVAALIAVRLVPQVADTLILSHLSVEVGHRLLVQALGARPLLDLDFRLGEGTGAALAMGLVEASLRILHEMATFETAGVSDSGV